MDSMASMTITAISAALAATKTSSMGTANLTLGMSNATAKPTMPMIDGMDMSCKIAMLWNWYTIDACFLSSSWHIRSHGMFAGSCIGTICLVLCLELMRRMGRDYDAFIVSRAHAASSAPTPPAKRVPKKVLPYQLPNRQWCSCFYDGTFDVVAPSSESSNAKLAGPNNITLVDAEAMQSVNGVATDRKKVEPFPPYLPSPGEQCIRALLHTIQFAVAYFIMLLAMYYNGYIIICIFIGAFLGSLIFMYQPLSLSKGNDATQVTKCCG